MILTNSLSSGGAERSMNLLANQLALSGVTVVLVPINASKEDFVKLQCEVWSPQRKWQGGLSQTIMSYIALSRFVKIWKPNAIILNCDLPELLGSLLTFKTTKFVVEHAPHPWNTRKLLGKFCRRLLKMQGSKFVAVSKHLQIWPDRIPPFRTIPNLISQFPTCSVVNAPKSIERLVFVGRLSDEKNPLSAIEIAQLADTPLRIFGDGNLSVKIKEEAAKLGVQLEMNGFVSNVWDSIGDTDLIIIPSKWEGDGLVVLEAIARNVPFLLSDIPDFRRFEFMEHVYCKDANSFAERILRYRNSPKLLLPEVEKVNQIQRGRDSSTITKLWLETLSAEIDLNNGDLSR
jgi:glycosyltransferase involved in cell wall biosynthesis